MQRTCTRCGGLSDGESRFCTNCGATLTTEQGHRQSWEACGPSALPWAQASPQAYQQAASSSAQNAAPGQGSPADAQIKRLLTIALCVIAGALLLLLTSIALVIVGPDSTRGFFLVIALLLILIPWIIYHQIRRFIRRTVGRIWWFM
ncbi:MAG TPA: hypothetical protein VGF67_14350 [Ktedonobacteraceae bacterium]|jgi:hypothetical protein